jgi:hypothetical protein
MADVAWRLEKAAAIFRDRNPTYGENWRKVGPVMTALFPEGVSLRSEMDHARFHILMLIVVKLTRYANAWEKGGHADSLDDLAVYAAMLAEIDVEASQKAKINELWHQTFGDKDE